MRADDFKERIDYIAEFVSEDFIIDYKEDEYYPLFGYYMDEMQDEEYLKFDPHLDKIAMIYAMRLMIEEHLEDYKQKYPHVDFVKYNVEILNYTEANISQYAHDIALGAALCLLDLLRQFDHLEEALEKLPLEVDISQTDLSGINHMYYSETLLKTVVSVIENFETRYFEGRGNILVDDPWLSEVFELIDMDILEDLEDKYYDLVMIWMNHFYEHLEEGFKEVAIAQEEAETIKEKLLPLINKRHQIEDFYFQRVDFIDVMRPVYPGIESTEELLQYKDEINHAYEHFKESMKVVCDILEHVDKEDDELRERVVIDDPYLICLTLVYMMFSCNSTIWYLCPSAYVVKRAMTMLPWTNGEAVVVMPDMPQDMSFDEYLKDIYHVREKIDASFQNVATLIAQIQERDETIKTLKNDLSKLKKDYKSLRHDYHELETQVDSEMKRLKDLSDSLDEKRRLMETEKEEVNKTQDDDVEISLPYTVKHRTLIYGGHRQWIKNMQRIINGNIQFAHADVTVSNELVRNMEVVWLQTNHMNHSGYYKMVEICKNNHIPFEYFKTSGTRSCTKSIALYDMEEARHG